VQPRARAVPSAVVVGDDALFDDGLFDDGLFAARAEERAAARLDVAAPLAVRMRPAGLDEVVGQERVIAPGTPLRRLVEGGGGASVILYGPPGTGKTTLGRLV